MLAFLKAAAGGAKLWLLISIAVAAFGLGGIVSWNLSAWKTGAGYSETLKDCASKADTALNEERTEHTQQLGRINEGIAVVAQKDVATSEDVNDVLTKLGGMNRAIRNLERDTLLLAVGVCNISADGDRMRDAAYRAATSGLSAPAGTGEANSPDDADGPAVSANTGQRPSVGRAGSGPAG